MSLHPVKIIGEGEKVLRLTGAVLMHQSDRGDVYVTSHPVVPDAQHPHRKVIGAGVPLTKGDLAKFADAVGAATAFSGFLPENLLFSSANLIAWWAPAQVRMTWFKKTGTGKIDGQGPAAHPALVFVATPGDWFVFALRDSVRPAPTARLYHAPHFNVWDGGRICTGNVALPPNVGVEVLAEYERAFFRSHFTHPNRGNSVKYKGGIEKLWRDQLAAPDTESMRRALVDSKETLQEAIARIAARATAN
nr:PRTRC system protein B [uncultured Massilia sp.]